MKRTLSFFLSLIMVIGIIASVPITVSAASVDDLTFTLNEGGISYSVTSCDREAEGELVIPETYNGLSVTSIGEWAFGGCIGLTSVIIPASVTSIGEWTFSDCTNLTSITIPDSVTSIGSYAFCNCTNLASITIPDSVTSIGDWAFVVCSSLTSINVDGNNAYYSSVNGVLFNKDKTVLIKYPESKTDTVYAIPDSVTSIGSSAFRKCDNLASVTIGNSVTSIGYEAFSDCTNLTSITIPDSVTSIGAGAFYNCTRLTSITIPDSVTSIGSDAFYNTSYYNDSNNWENDVLYIGNHLIDAKTSISGNYTIKAGTKTIANYAFCNCTNLTSVTIGNSVTSIGYRAFWFCENLASITLPNSVTSIGDGAFYNCTRLTSITILDSVTSIGFETFENCFSLTSITIPDSVTSIGSYAFCNCTNLTSVTIGNSVTSIGYGAFYDCSNLKDVNYLGTVDQWEEIDIEARNKCLTEAYYSQFSPPATPKLSSTTRISNGVKVSWNVVEGADSYIVYRKTSKSGWTNLGTTTENTFTDTKAKTGSTYYYTVKAQNEAGASGYNKTGLKIKYVAAPKLTKIANESSGVRVYWSKVSGADGYYLYRRVAGSKSWTKVATIKKGSTTSYLDKKASGGKTYEYIIKCYDGSTPSASAAKTIKIKRLTVPKLVSAKSAKAGITVKWGKVSGAEGYYVYRKTGSGSWVKLTTVKGNTKVSYVDKSAKKGKTYTYTVKAYSGSYTSAYNTKGLKIKDKY